MNAKTIVFYLFLALVLQSCGGDDEGDASPIVGVWNFSKIEVTKLAVDGQDLLDFYLSLGLAEEDAQIAVDLFETSVLESSELAGATVEFKSNNTYTASQPNQNDETGSWSLNSEGTKLTIDSFTYDVKTLSATKLVLGLEQEDTSDEVTVEIAMEISFSK